MDDQNQDFGDQGSQAEGQKGGQAGMTQIQDALGGVEYPARKEDLINAARENGAGENIIGALEGLPDQQFNSAADLSEALGSVR